MVNKNNVLSDNSKLIAVFFYPNFRKKKMDTGSEAIDSDLLTAIAIEWCGHLKPDLILSCSPESQLLQ